VSTSCDIPKFTVVGDGTLTDEAVEALARLLLAIDERDIAESQMDQGRLHEREPMPSASLPPESRARQSRIAHLHTDREPDDASFLVHKAGRRSINNGAKSPTGR
jgi:hypothetical protein